MNTLQPTIVLGLGQRGRWTLEYLKKRIVNTYGKDPENPENPELPGVKLLALDVEIPNVAEGTSGELKSDRLLTNELVGLTLKEAFDNPKNAQQVCPWLTDDILSSETDWAETRAGARVAWHMNLSEWTTTFDNYLQNICGLPTLNVMQTKGFRRDSQRMEANLIVVADLGEAVAGGGLIDVIYKFMNLLKTLNLQSASTGVLFMPATNQADKIGAEARAYATLKELNAYMNGSQTYTCRYVKLHETITYPGAPFNRGCYLIDNHNERGLALRSDAEVAVLAGEWLFRTLLTPLKGRVDAFVTEPGQFAGYSSFGLTVETFPIDRLVDYSAYQLGDELITDKVLEPVSFTVVMNTLTDFYNANNLRPDGLFKQKLMRRSVDGSQMQFPSSLDRELRSVFYPYTSMGTTVKSIQRRINEQFAPDSGLRREIVLNAREVPQTVGEKIRQQVIDLLKAYPNGGLSHALQFVTALRDETQEYSASLTRRRAVFQAKKQQQLNEDAMLEARLDKAVASIPPAWVTIASILFGVLAPLALIGVWLVNTEIWSPVLRIIAFLCVTAVSAGAVAYAAITTYNDVNIVRSAYNAYLRNSFETELNLAAIDEAIPLYQDVAAAASDEVKWLEQFCFLLHDIAVEFKRQAREMKPGLCGEMEFAWQKSILNEKLIETLYQRYLGKNGIVPRFQALIDQLHTVDEWKDLRQENIVDKIVTFCKGIFAPMQELTIEDVLKETELITPDLAQQYIRTLQDKSAPLITCNNLVLAQSAMPLRQTLVGIAEESETGFRTQFEQVIPQTIFEPTGDKHSLIVTSIRKRIPIYSLSRINEMKRRYLDAVESRHEALHVEGKLALIPDVAASLIPGASHHVLSGATAFALGRQLNLIKQDDSGKYAILDPDGHSVSALTNGRIESAVLLGADESVLASMSDWIETVGASKGNEPFAGDLKEYLRAADVADWERTAIKDYILQLLA